MTDGQPAVQDWWNPFTWFPTDPISLLVIFAPVLLVIGVIVVGTSAAASAGPALVGTFFGSPQAEAPPRGGPRVIVVKR